MPTVSITQAAEIARVSISTITRAMDKGRLSATILPNGKRVVDPSELERVFPSNAPTKRASLMTQTRVDDGTEHATCATGNATDASVGTGAHGHATEILLAEQCEDLRKRLDRAEALLDRADARIEDLLSDQRRMALLLEDDRRKALLILDDKRQSPPQEVQRIASKPTEPAHRFKPPKMAKAATGRDKKQGKSGKTQKGRKK